MKQKFKKVVFMKFTQQKKQLTQIQKKNVDYYRSLETCGLDIVGWVKADDDWESMFTQVYGDEVEWLGDNEE